MNARSLLALLLLAVVGVCGTVAWQHYLAERITEQDQLAKARALFSVIPASLYDNQPLKQPLALVDTTLDHSTLLQGYLATLAGQPAVVLLLSRTQGYGGPMELLIAIDPEGRLVGSKLLEHNETPGIGGRMADPGNTWLNSFTGQSLSRTDDAGWALKKDHGQFDQLAGATVTSRAAVDALHDALRYFDAHRTTLLPGAAHE
jgi:electron transport complex protein RnfG